LEFFNLELFTEWLSRQDKLTLQTFFSPLFQLLFFGQIFFTVTSQKTKKKNIFRYVHIIPGHAPKIEILEDSFPFLNKKANTPKHK